ncbi:MAG: GatB/YqeY domain-containing protein [Deltaproteobacteria bacterium]|nr:GatB/YqeY domain-containing protein [Deltaproteobacteria bacterium]
MPIDVQLNDMLKEAMRNKDSRAANCVRMIKTKFMERRTAPGFKGELNDELWLDVITAYQKQMKKSRDEYAGLGDRGAEALEQLDYEIAFCQKFLPQLAGEDEVRAAVNAVVAASGVTDVKQSGKVVGEVMKANKGKFDAAMVKRLVEEALAAK